MRISRLFVKSNLNIGQQLELDDNAAHYLRTVLRLQAKQQIVLFNGLGGEYLCQLSEVSKKSVRLSIEKFIDRDVESPLTVKLGLGISRGDRMDWAVQKAIELGVNQITPLVTERCVIKFNDDKKQQRLTHWQHISQHASEQSGRTRVADICEINSLPDWVSQQTHLKIFLDPNANQALCDLSPESATITLLSGPEGGFSDHERELAKASGFIPIRIGQRILRTETAALAALTAVQTLWGDFN